MAKAYTHPEVLVSTDWVDQHKADDNVRLVEVDVDTIAYPSMAISRARWAGIGRSQSATMSAATF